MGTLVSLQTHLKVSAGSDRKSAGIRAHSAGFEQPGLVEGVSAHGWVCERDEMIFKVPLNPNHSVIT